MMPGVKGAGTILLGGGNFTLDGSASVSNVVVAGASVSGTAVISGIWTWTSGRFSNGSALTVTSNGMLVLAGQTNVDYLLYGVVTNAGTVRLVAGILKCTIAVVTGG